MTWILSVTVVTQDGRGGVLCGVFGHQNQLRSGHCCTCSAPCEARPPLGVVPAIVLLIICNFSHRLQQCKGISITISASGLFGHRSVLLPLPLLQYGLTSHSLFRGVTCRSLDLSMATDALRCTCSSMDLSTATGTSGCPPPTWTYPQVTVPSSQVGTGAPACPAQQHRHSSDALATGQPRHMATAVIKMLPGTAG